MSLTLNREVGGGKSLAREGTVGSQAKFVDVENRLGVWNLERVIVGTNASYAKSKRADQVCM